MVETIEFCLEWSEKFAGREVPAKAKHAYVEEELRRLRAEGKPVLRAVLTCAEDDVQTIALHTLSTGTTKAGEMLFADHDGRVDLQLVKDAVPPARDPQGRDLKPAAKGSLVAKVGNHGGMLDPRTEAREAMEFTGERRTIKQVAGQDIYRCVTVGKKPTSVPFRDAVTVLRQWGFGIAPRRHLPARPGEPEGQCMWLVEETVTAPSSRAAG